MIMQWIVSLSLMSSAGVDEILRAKNSAQILDWHRGEEEVLILRQRCEAEVRGGFFPTNCFLWEKKAKLPPRQKKFYQQWFDTACVKSLRNDVTLARLHLSALRKMTGACRHQMVKSAKAWLYKVQKEGEADIFQNSKIGKEIEIVLSHGTLENKKPFRPQTLGTLR